jgi:hypothetical protein
VNSETTSGAIGRQTREDLADLEPLAAPERVLAEIAITLADLADKLAFLDPEGRLTRTTKELRETIGQLMASRGKGEDDELSGLADAV